MPLRKIKAISVPEPLGEFIAKGKKTIEIRESLETGLRLGEDLLIVQHKELFRGKTLGDLPGKALAVVRVVEMRPFVYEDRALAKTERFDESWWAWVLADIRPLSSAQPCSARAGLYEVELDLPEPVL